MIREHGVVVLRQPRDRGVQRTGVEGAPLAVMDALDAVGDDDMGVQLRIRRSRVVMVVGRSNHATDLDLRNSPRADPPSWSGHRYVALDDAAEHVLHRLVVSLGDEHLGARIADRPERRDGLGRGEGSKPAMGERSRLAGFFRGDRRDLRGTFSLIKILRQPVDPALDLLIRRRELAVGARPSSSPGVRMLPVLPSAGAAAPRTPGHPRLTYPARSSRHRARCPEEFPHRCSTPRARMRRLDRGRPLRLT